MNSVSNNSINLLRCDVRRMPFFLRSYKIFRSKTLHSYNLFSSGSEKNTNVCVHVHVYIHRERESKCGETLIIG